jgi:hypothetical protein
MRSIKLALMLGLAALAFAACEGCGGNPDGPAELAKLPPPSSSSTGRAQSQPPPPKAKPKFGSPPKSQMAPPAGPSS